MDVNVEGVPHNVRIKTKLWRRKPSHLLIIIWLKECEQWKKTTGLSQHLSCQSHGQMKQIISKYDCGAILYDDNTKSWCSGGFSFEWVAVDVASHGNTQVVSLQWLQFVTTEQPPIRHRFESEWRLQERNDFPVRFHWLTCQRICHMTFNTRWNAQKATCTWIPV